MNPPILSQGEKLLLKALSTVMNIKVYKFSYYREAEEWLDLNYGIAIGREHTINNDSFTHVLISSKLNNNDKLLLMEFLPEPKQVLSKAGHSNYLCKTSGYYLHKIFTDYNFLFVN